MFHSFSFTLSPSMNATQRLEFRTWFAAPEQGKPNSTRQLLRMQLLKTRTFDDFELRSLSETLHASAFSVCSQFSVTPLLCGNAAAALLDALVPALVRSISLLAQVPTCRHQQRNLRPGGSPHVALLVVLSPSHIIVKTLTDSGDPQSTQGQGCNCPSAAWPSGRDLL